MRALLAIFSLAVFTMVVSCGSETIHSENGEKGIAIETNYRSSLQAVEYEVPSLDWNENPDCPCENEGTRCPVIHATPAHKDLIDNSDWETLFDGGNATLGLPDDVVEDVLNGEKEVYPLNVYDNVYHLRIK